MKCVVSAKRALCTHLKVSLLIAGFEAPEASQLLPGTWGQNKSLEQVRAISSEVHRLMLDELPNVGSAALRDKIKTIVSA